MHEKSDPTTVSTISVRWGRSLVSGAPLSYLWRRFESVVKSGVGGFAMPCRVIYVLEDLQRVGTRFIIVLARVNICLLL